MMAPFMIAVTQTEDASPGNYVTLTNVRNVEFVMMSINIPGKMPSIIYLNLISR